MAPGSDSFLLRRAAVGCLAGPHGLKRASLGAAGAHVVCAWCFLCSLCSAAGEMSCVCREIVVQAREEGGSHPLGILVDKMDPKKFRTPGGGSLAAISPKFWLIGQNSVVFVAAFWVYGVPTP